MATAGSNIAVDNMLERLAKYKGKGEDGLKLVRVGHPARVMAHLGDYSLDAQVKRQSEDVIAEIRKQI